jgi:hypothetical protein
LILIDENNLLIILLILKSAMNIFDWHINLNISKVKLIDLFEVLNDTIVLSQKDF